jgi:hypothetical protein
LSSNELTLLPQLFDAYPSVFTWRIDYQIENARLITGLASLVLIKNQLPQSGVCSVYPNNGTSFETMFNISCRNWLDSDGSIVRYEYFGNYLKKRFFKKKTKKKFKSETSYFFCFLDSQ